jgi:hypothetical protein
VIQHPSPGELSHPRYPAGIPSSSFLTQPSPTSLSPTNRLPPSPISFFPFSTDVGTFPGSQRPNGPHDHWSIFRVKPQPRQGDDSDAAALESKMDPHTAPELALPRLFPFLSLQNSSYHPLSITIACPTSALILILLYFSLPPLLPYPLYSRLSSHPSIIML